MVRDRLDEFMHLLLIQPVLTAMCIQVGCKMMLTVILQPILRVYPIIFEEFVQPVLRILPLIFEEFVQLVLMMLPLIFEESAVCWSAVCLVAAKMD